MCVCVCVNECICVSVRVVSERFSECVRERVLEKEVIVSDISYRVRMCV